jgi:hypothetical protein
MSETKHADAAAARSDDRLGKVGPAVGESWPVRAEVRSSQVRTEPLRGVRTGAPQKRPHRYLTLEELLIWAYRDQKVDRMAQASLADLEASADGDEPHHRASTDGVCTMQRIASLGARIPGSTSWGASATYHPDAGEVMAAIGKLGWQHAGLIVNYARIGDRPERSDVLPMPHPMSPHTLEDRYGRAKHDGQQILYKIIVTEREFVKVPIYEPRSRARKRVPQIIGYETRVVETEACPIDWWPAPQLIAMENAIYEGWVEAMNALWRLMQGVTLKDHTLTGIWVVSDAEADQSA